MPTIRIDVVEGNILETRSDLLLLKYAQKSYGLDEEVASRLQARGLLPKKWRGPRVPVVECIDTKGEFPFRFVMFVGTPPLIDFDYSQMTVMTRRALIAISERGIPVRHITTTVHGGGYGLDIRESLQRLSAGFTSGPEDSSVQRVTFVEGRSGYVKMLGEDAFSQEIERIADVLAVPIEDTQEPDGPAGSNTAGRMIASDTRVPAMAETHEKELIFVAVPFAEEFEDVYQFGIYGPVKKHGFVCEHVGQSAFTGDVLVRIREKIGSSCLVIADLTLERPNVYLEVGYAWGRNVPVVILAREGEELHFDVQTHRCITYRNITDLARKLDNFLADFVAVD